MRTNRITDVLPCKRFRNRKITQRDLPIAALRRKLQESRRSCCNLRRCKIIRKSWRKFSYRKNSRFDEKKNSLVRLSSNFHSLQFQFSFLLSAINLSRETDYPRPASIQAIATKQIATDRTPEGINWVREQRAKTSFRAHIPLRRRLDTA